ncbi:PspA/IM30 family protein [uncultured Thiodictyon sp.]|uniref:PspA/IM30 family protein n=1 Tax=uncultured Thiodictyon sp. TaxID=1846217 RepID=UPI0025FD3BF5|nr:PspA/IM30 family protein [uncultured Thiodictyon sp.]
MALMTRLARLVRADLNAVLDRLEAPELVLAQSVREMEQALDQGRQALTRLDRELARLALRETALAQEEARTADALAEGLTEGREALARPLIRRRLETAGNRVRLQTRRAELTQERGRLAARVESQAARLDELRSRAALYTPDAPPSADDDRGPLDPAWSAPDTGISDAEVELELLRLRRQGAST